MAIALRSAGKTYTKSDAAHVDYPDTGGTELTNSSLCTTSSYGGANGSVYASDVAVTIGLSSVWELSYARFHMWGSAAFNSPHPASVAIYGSNDNTNFNLLASFNQSGNWNVTDAAVGWSNNLAIGGRYRYVRFTFTRGSTYVSLGELEVYGDYPASGVASVDLSSGFGVS